MTQNDSSIGVERRALSVGKWGNLFMGVAGVLAAWMSHSQALLVDGLFSLIGFLAAVFGARVTANALLAPDRKRPLGYSADESIFVTFRAMSLLALVIFAACNAMLNIFTYASGGDIAKLNFGPIMIYFAVIFVVCCGIAANHHFSWVKTGRQSAILKLEARAATFDGLITLAAGLGLSAMPLLADGPLGWLTPIGDSVVVLILCLLVVGRYLTDFKAGLAELAGISAPGKTVAVARRAVRGIFEEAGGRLTDLAVLKSGRVHTVLIYYDPGMPITADTVDTLTRSLDARLDQALGPSASALIISRHGRVLQDPDSRDPAV